MEIDYQNIDFNSTLREDTLRSFKEMCKDEYVEFMKLFTSFSKLDKFLSSKCEVGDNKSKEYYTRVMHIRVKDHFSSSLILVSQGFTVDAISLTRSAMEDMFVILNFYLDPNYFNNWKNNKAGFKIKPGNLRNNKRIEKEDRKLFNKVYKSLSNIVHPKINSLNHMMKYHPTVLNDGTEGLIRLKKDAKLINMSLFVYLNQMINLLRKIYTNDQDINNLDRVKSEIPNVFGLFNEL
ncbi:hypothetical protein [Ornithinibacillus contaminans]|uniref:hypothetical protein n=1 Tax=Ornithinibacillus contaminans TaxID=694055 RepID=UPI00064DF582|nr:hypothetical protein [Ornithinibacillus contaminans]